MILQALCKQYELLRQKEENGLPEYGYSIARVSFALLLDDDGSLRDILDLRIQSGSKLKFRPMLVPVQKGRQGKNPPPYFLCDNEKYVLGIGNDGKSRFEAFRIYHETVLGADNPLVRFLRQWEPEQWQENEVLAKYREDMLKGGLFVIRLTSKGFYMHQDEESMDRYRMFAAAGPTEAIMGQCLVTGEKTRIVQVHPQIKGVKNAQPSGAALVGFNDRSFESYGKEQAFNAPVGEKAAFQYTTVLNYMLADNKYCLKFNDTTVVFWASEDNPVCLGVMASIFSGEQETIENANYRNLAKDILSKLYDGRSLQGSDYGIDMGVQVYILGLSPNNARLSVAFWQVNTFEMFAKKLGEHYHDLKIVGGAEILPVWRILAETISKNARDKKTSPVMEKALLAAILSGGLYPASLYNAMIVRIRADGDVNSRRAAIIKAYLNRKYRITRVVKEEITMALNENSSNVAYQLGRLFAVLEKAQEDALGPSVNATIKDRYFSSASTSPAAVFPALLRLSVYHVSKAKWGKRWEWLKGDIMACLSESFPRHLSLDEQGQFMIGYYQLSKLHSLRC